LISCCFLDSIGGVMVSMLVSNVINHGSSSSRVKQKTIKLVLAVSQLSTQHKGERTETGWLRIRIMCLNEMSVCRLLFQ
jgi:hypothetical protein